MAEMGGQNVVGIAIPAFVVRLATLTLVTFVTRVGCGAFRWHNTGDLILDAAVRRAGLAWALPKVSVDGVLML